MKKSNLLQNPWVISVLGIGLAALASCNPFTLTRYKKAQAEKKQASKGWTSQDPKNAQELICKEVTPPAKACTKRASSFILTTDFLYWGVKQEQFTYASSFDTSSNKYSHLQSERKWGPGFRIGLGGNLSYNNWDVLLNWTHWDNPKSHSVSKTSASIVPTLLQSSEAVDAVSSASLCQNLQYSWHMSLNVYDLELGRFFSISKKLKLRPHVGLELSQIHQNFSVEYSNFSTPLSGSDYETFKGTNNFSGIGPRIGIHSRWMLGKYVGIFGNAAGSLLCGKTHAQSRLLAVNASVLRFSCSEHSVKPMTQLSLGLDWSKAFAEKYFLKIGVAYENQVWWNQLIIPTKASYDKNGTLTTQGLTANIYFEF